jgi:hypothetical protein
MHAYIDVENIAMSTELITYMLHRLSIKVVELINDEKIGVDMSFVSGFNSMSMICEPTFYFKKQ